MSKPKGFQQHCPVATATELLAKRWTFLIMRELLGGRRSYNRIRKGVPNMSTALLSERLRELEHAKVITKHALKGQKGYEYQLTESGEELRSIVELLGVWGLRWIRHDVNAKFYDPGPLMWTVREKLHTEHLPPERLVVEFDFGPVQKKKRKWWLITEAGEVDLCVIPPGFEIDVFICTDIATLQAIWLDRLAYKEAIRQKTFEIHGPRKLVEAFPRWFGRSPFVDAAKELHPTAKVRKLS